MEPRKGPSFFVPSPSLHLFVLFLLLSFLPPSTAQPSGSSGPTVAPSNSSADLSWTHGVRFHLENSQTPLPPSISVAPLTQSLVSLDNHTLSSFRASGTLVDVDASNSRSLDTADIAFVSCDASAYPGNLDASETVASVLTSLKQPKAILLYSTEVNHCNYSSNAADGSSSQYANVFTLLSPHVAKLLRDNFTPSNNGSTSIVSNMSFAMTGTTGSQTDSSGGGDSPNTAMIILYSITGIITALFLAIIITGAVRAHRHPERYGPRYTAGRPRQSRARGIARAMLETIPIVKFGDEHDPKMEAVKGDVELGSEYAATTTEENRDANVTGATAAPDSTERQKQNVSESATTQPTAPEPDTPERKAEGDTPAAAPTNTTEHNFSCPICTDDFVKGQDMRVLPCNHQFHPECIDPWLVNVSGTCPLCRIDLNPSQPDENEHEAGEGTETAHDASTSASAGQTPAEATQHRRPRFTSYLHGPLNARRMRDATVEERLAALRSVRETNRTDNDDENDERQRRRLTSRLRERFRIRTRAHGDGQEGSTTTTG